MQMRMDNDYLAQLVQSFPEIVPLPPQDGHLPVPMHLGQMFFLSLVE